jgi:hypothetical protein
MEKSLRELRLGSENSYVNKNQNLLRCTQCNGTFQEPLLATLSSGGSVQTYNACPRCLSKVSEVKHQKSEADEQASISTRNVKKVVVKTEEDVKCKHFLGYLKKHPKSTPFPDECLVCDKMIECMTH